MRSSLVRRHRRSRLLGRVMVVGVRRRSLVGVRLSWLVGVVKPLGSLLRTVAVKSWGSLRWAGRGPRRRLVRSEYRNRRLPRGNRLPRWMFRARKATIPLWGGCRLAAWTLLRLPMMAGQRWALSPARMVALLRWSLVQGWRGIGRCGWWGSRDSWELIRRV